MSASNRWPGLAAISLLLLGAICAVADGLRPELPGIDVNEKRDRRGATFSLRNPHLAEMTVSLEFTLDNPTPSVRVPFQIVIAPQFTTPPLVALRPTDPLSDHVAPGARIPPQVVDLPFLVQSPFC